MAAGMWGANTDSLRDFALDCSDAEDVIDTSSRLLERETEGVTWFGQDATEFKEKFSQTVLVALAALEANLQSVAKTVDQHAADQDETSASRGQLGSLGPLLKGASEASAGIRTAGASSDSEYAADTKSAQFGNASYGDSEYANRKDDGSFLPEPDIDGGSDSTWPMEERPDLDDILERYQVSDSKMRKVPFGDESIEVTQAEAVFISMLLASGQYDEFLDIKDDAEKYGLRPRDDNAAGHIDGHGDAERHAYWNARMTQEFGEWWTEKFATAHEQRPSNNAHEEAMDLYNNEVGRRIGAENPDASPEELQALVEQAYDNGELLVIGPDGEIIWSDQLPPGEHYSHQGGPADGRYRGNVGKEDYSR